MESLKKETKATEIARGQCCADGLKSKLFDASGAQALKKLSQWNPYDETSLGYLDNTQPVRSTQQDLVKKKHHKTIYSPNINEDTRAIEKQGGVWVVWIGVRGNLTAFLVLGLGEARHLLA